MSTGKSYFELNWVFVFSSAVVVLHGLCVTLQRLRRGTPYNNVGMLL